MMDTRKRRNYRQQIKYTNAKSSGCLVKTSDGQKIT
jgi:hypothetical protein